jgi:hypothetical protein
LFAAKHNNSGSKPLISVLRHIDFCGLAQLYRLNGLLGTDLDLSILKSSIISHEKSLPPLKKNDKATHAP